MLNKIYEFTLDLENNTYIPSIEFYKNDTDTSRIEITLKNDYQTLNLEGFTIVCKILKADDLELQNIVDIVDKDNGLIAINLSSQALASIGTNTVQLSIYEGLKRLSSKEFTYTVKDTLIDEEGIVSQNEYTLLTQLISSVQNIEDIINTSEITRVANEGTRIDNEATREVQEQARQSLKGQMDSLKVALDSLKTSMEVLKADVETSESTRELNETDRELLKAGMETLKSTLEALEVSLSTNETNRGLIFNSKIDAIDNKIIDVEARSVAKENLIDNKIVEVENRTLVKEALVDNKIVEANATIANVNIAKTNTETVTANANAKISETETTRQSIIATINNLVAQFNALAPASSTNVEVQLARTDITGKTHVSLQERLLADNKQQNILYSSVEGTYIASDSVDGYAKNVVIEGNTYQNPLNLAEIKSTGTKLSDGRYEIPLLCINSNYVDYDLATFGKGRINEGTGVIIVDGTGDGYTAYIKIKPNTAYVFEGHTGKSFTPYALYDKNKTYLRGGSGTKFTFNSSTDAVYIRISLYSDLKTGYLYEASAYENRTYLKNESHKVTILSDYQIEKVGTVADRIVQLADGKWYIEKNDATYAFTGNENFINGAVSATGGRYKAEVSISDSKLTSAIICNKLPYLTWASSPWTVDYELISCVDSTNRFVFYIKGTTIEDVKNWVKNNTPTVKYQLATPVYYPLPDDQQIALRTFANKTNILSLCEIEPTIKCDVPKSVGASIGAITNHLDNVDLELEKIKKLEDATNSTVITDKDFVNIVDTGNGYLSDVKLDGRTLVNLLKYNFDLVLISGVIKTDETTRWKLERGTAVSAKGYITFSNLKPNTKYTLKVTQVNSINDKFAIYDYIAGVFIVTYTSNSTITFTTKSNVTDTRLYIDNTIDITTYLYKTILLIEGEQLYQSNYFEGLKSVGQDVNKLVVSSIGENLYDENSTLYNTGINATSGEVTNNYADWCTSPFYIRIVKGNTYYINRGASSSTASTSPGYIYAYQYSTSKSFASRLDIGIANNSFVATVDGYVRLTMKYSSLKSFALTTKVLPYKEYQTDKKEILYLDTVDSTWKKPVLRGKWESGKLIFGDTVEKLADGKYRYRNGTKEIVLNGSENITLPSLTTVEVNTMRFEVNNIISASITSKNLMSDKLGNGSTTDTSDFECMEIVGGVLYVKILKSKLTTLDVAGFKTWLTTNNVTIVYQLQAELVYECTPIDLSSFDSETNYSLECGVLSPRSTIKCQNYIGNIINTMKEKISLQENTNNFLMAMALDHEIRVSLIEGGM